MTFRRLFHRNDRVTVGHGLRIVLICAALGGCAQQSSEPTQTDAESDPAPGPQETQPTQPTQPITDTDHNSTSEESIEVGAPPVFDDRIYEVCTTGNVDELVALLDAGVDPNQARNSGWTPLMAAARVGELTCIETLLASGADPDLQFYNGATAIMIAIASERTEVIRLLIGADADLDVVSAAGETALHVATIHNHPSIARMLIHAGAAVDVQSGTGFTPLMLAASRSSLDIMQDLIDHHAALDPSDHSGFSALSWSVFAGDRASTELLIQSGADVNHQIFGVGRIFGGETPLMLAVANADLDRVQLLLDAGADPSLATTDGQTALSLALAEDANSAIVDSIRKALQQSNAMTESDRNGSEDKD